jgi:hypothetical protein
MNLEPILSAFSENAHSPEFIAIIVLSFLVLILFVLYIKQHRRINKILRGKSAMTIEDSLIEIAKELDMLTEYKEESEEYLKKVEVRLRKSIQSVEARRFNPFKGTGAGGNQSFAVSFLNENGEGLILSSLYSSDRMSVFAKPVHKFVSPYELTDEETAALEKSMDVVAVER